MQLAFTPEQTELARSARRFLGERSSSERVRAAMGSEPGYDADTWRHLASELGWTALTIPEAYGGFGLTYAELLPLSEEMGRSLLCAPFFATIALGANALLVAGTEAQKQRWLPPIAAGEAFATLAFEASATTLGRGAVGVRGTRTGAGWALEGEARYVLEGHLADVLIVAAVVGEEVEVFAVPKETEGLVWRRRKTMDPTRSVTDVRFDGARLPEEARMEGGWAAVDRTLDLARVSLAAEQVGGAEACLDMAVDYAKTRVQFGRAIGSFQAIKHKCADMLLLVESARSAAYHAHQVAAAASLDPSVDARALREAASLAQVYCSEAYFHCAAENIQIHGGIGFTWEHDAHLHFKRARACESFLGTPDHHRERFAREVL